MFLCLSGSLNVPSADAYLGLYERASAFRKGVLASRNVFSMVQWGGLTLPAASRFQIYIAEAGIDFSFRGVFDVRS
jgi:hypothetical protein